MSSKTNIGWCDSTVNPTSGCDGCELWAGDRRKCYAGVLHETRLAKAFPQMYAKDFRTVTLLGGRMAKAAAWSDLRGVDRIDKPWLNGRPRHIFISDMADALSAAVPDKFLLNEIIANVTSPAGRRHIWLWLTKQPQRMAEFCRWLEAGGEYWPPNLWAGTSVTNQATADLRIPHLLKVSSAVHFVSVEPMLGAIDFGPPERFRIDWVIVGGESGPMARPLDIAALGRLANPAWRGNCALFIKQDSGLRPGRQGCLPKYLWDLKEIPAL